VLRERWVNPVRTLNARARWTVPVGVLAAVGIIAAATAMASASVPSLPNRTAAQLVAEAIRAISKPPGPFTATVQETADFGLPQLPQAVEPSGAAGLMSGTQTVTIWYRDPQHIRISHPVQAGESDLRLNRRTLWLWNSKTQTATKVTLPDRFAGLPVKARNGAGLPCPPATASSACASLTPQAAASLVLKALGPSTIVAVDANVKAPTGPAYQLALEPRTSQSLIGKVVIAIDASSHLPVSVEVFGRGSTGVVFSVGFSALAFGAPAASNFTFTPPPGATVKTQTVPGSPGTAFGPMGLNPPPGLKALKLRGVAVGSASQAGPPPLPGTMPVIPIPKQALGAINAKFAASLPASMSDAQRAAAIKQFDKQFKIVTSMGMGSNGGAFFSRKGAVRLMPGGPLIRVGPGPANIITKLGSNGGGFFNRGVSVMPGGPGVKVIGKDWLTVLATPANPNVAAEVRALLSAKGPALPAPGNQGLFGSSSASSSASSSSWSSSTSPYSSALTIQSGPNLGLLRALLLATTPVHGTWGSGRLLQTKVVTVLITSKGQILAGAVTPAVLYADVPAAG